MLSILRRVITIDFPFWNSGWRKYQTSSLSNIIDLHPKVEDALALRKPVVALESTIITHGMPYPNNLETAIEVENIVEKEGATPATIAIIDGRIKVGLTAEQLQRLSNIGHENSIKCSRRDLAYVICKKLCGGTTVAGTLIIANTVGIKLFATGGIGGVHRDGHVTFDVSADLMELGRTPITVVSSGIKSILDIPRTLEYLETQGVCVCSYQSPDGEFPAFYTRSSGVRVPYNLNNPQEIAELINSSLRLNLQSGILVGVPIPKEHSISEHLINNAIEKAVNKAQIEGITGKKVTPFILEAVRNITAGKSLSSNIALIKNNALVAAQTSVQLEKIRLNHISDQKYFFNRDQSDSSENRPVVVGASILDMCLRVNDDDLKLNGATYTIECKTFGGGVGRNIAEGLCKLYGKIHFISAIGDDEFGGKIKSQIPSCCHEGIITNAKNPTSVCTVVFDKYGDCKLVLGDMKIHQSITPQLIINNESKIAKSPLVIMDSNISVDTMGTLLEISKKYNKPVFFEPTDMRIAGKPFQLPRELTQQIKFISPNIFELQEIVRTINKSAAEIDPQNIRKTAKYLLESVQDNFDCIILTIGETGIVVGRSEAGSSEHYFDKNLKYIPQVANSRRFRFYKAPKVVNLVNVSGAGDSFTSGFLSAMLKGKTESECVYTGFYSAQCSLKSEGAVPDKYVLNDDEKELCLQHAGHCVDV